MIRIRTGYSLRSAFGSPEAALARVEGKYAPITDRASSYGWVRWQKCARKNEKIPVFGIELQVTPAVTEKIRELKSDHWVFFSRCGDLAPLNRAVSRAFSRSPWAAPLVTLEEALGSHEIAAVVGRKTPPRWLPEKPGEVPLYFALSPGLNPCLADEYLARGLVPVLAGDNLYPTPEDRDAYEIAAGRGRETQTWPRHILHTEELRQWLLREGYSGKLIKNAWRNARKLLETASKAELHKAELPLPRTPGDLREMCYDASLRLFSENEWTDIYEDRLSKELALIEAKRYEDYFLIVWDICQWARERMLVGPARGSSCGSLVCYLLGITSIDPIPHGLIFERFVDINRDDMPDIDIDFPEHRREEVIAYIREAYGHDHAARLGTVMMYRPRSALKETAGALGVSPGYTEPVLNSLIERSSGDARALDTLEDTLDGTESGQALMVAHPEARIACALEGSPSGTSKHASAIVLTRGELADYAPVNLKTQALMVDKKDAEELNILKVDVLGLTQLSILEYACELAGQDYRDLYDVPLRDPKTIRLLAEKRYSGIFQFWGSALLSVARAIDIDRFEDICAITALARPGPLGSGNTQKWIELRKLGRELEFPEILNPMLKETNGIVIYQEQVMQIGREIGGLTWEDVTDLRKAMSKSLGEEYFNQYGDRWKAGAIAKGMDPDYCEKLWTDLCAYGSWSFNKSHSVAYGMISYWCAWFKARWPVEFAAASLSFESDLESQRIILRELEAEGVGYTPVDPETSGERWRVGRNGSLVGPLGNIRGIGPKTVNAILGARARGEPLTDAQRKKLHNATTDLDSLYPCRGNYARLVPDPAARNIVSKPTLLRNVQGKVAGDEEFMVVCVFTRINPRSMNEEIKVAQRGGKRIEGEPHMYLICRLRDDTGEILAMINRWDYARLAKPIVDRGRPEKELYALKGTIKPLDEATNIFNISAVRYLGGMQ